MNEYVCPNGCKPTTFTEREVYKGQRVFTEKGAPVPPTKLCCSKCGAEAKVIKPIHG